MHVYSKMKALRSRISEVNCIFKYNRHKTHKHIEVMRPLDVCVFDLTAMTMYFPLSRSTKFRPLTFQFMCLFVEFHSILR